jgi:hypothetical protein
MPATKRPFSILEFVVWAVEGVRHPMYGAGPEVDGCVHWDWEPGDDHPVAFYHEGPEPEWEGNGE